jgi:hypothetical protein
MSGCHIQFRIVFLHSSRQSWLVSSVVILLSDSSLLCYVLTVHNCLFWNSAYLTENSRQGVIRVRYCVLEGRVKLRFSIFFRVSTGTVFCWAVCSHKRRDSISLGRL